MTVLASNLVRFKDSNTAYGLSDDDYNALESSMKSLQLIGQLCDEYNPSMATIPAELVAAALSLVTEKLEDVLNSAKHSRVKFSAGSD